MANFEFRGYARATVFYRTYFEVDAETEEEARELLMDNPYDFEYTMEDEDMHDFEYIDEDDWECINAPPPKKVLEIPQWREYGQV